MRVLGIDPGSETLGWGVVEGSGNKYSLVGSAGQKTAAAVFKASGKDLAMDEVGPVCSPMPSIEGLFTR